MIKRIIRIVLIFVSGLVFCDCYSQNPLVKQWDKRFGGSRNDFLTCFQQTNDGGYILGGYSNSVISGDKTQTKWGIYDYWIIKIDSSGNKEWDKDFKANDSDYLYALKQTSDGGYIIGGYSRSGIGGTKTQDTWGSYDYWVIKTDSLGQKQWDKDFGGNNIDQLYSVQQTFDGGYILGGRSYSGISGDKTQSNWGYYDFWMVKIDSFGNKQWDKDFGGTSEDWLYSLQQTSDGGYILGGWSNSGISGDKTEDNWDTIPYGRDYWIVKTDSLGNKLWDKDFGGTNNEKLFSLQQTVDKGYILGGYSLSGISGDKTQANWGDYDYWIVKIDSVGNKQWDKDFGGTNNEDDFGMISQTDDGGYLMSGTSFSHISGDKTENNLGMEQTWVIKTDSLGNKQWDKTLHNNSVLHLNSGFTIQTKDGCYAMTNYNDGGIGGDRSQPNWDTVCLPACKYDYWIIKFCDTTLTIAIPNLQSSLFNLQLFPNPATGSVHLTLPVRQAGINTKHNAPLECEIINIMGEKVYKFQIPPSSGGANLQTRLDVSFLAKGIYLVRVGDGERWENRKLVIE
ncbi:MAG TPA: T9SS type A sorting domain-containing protein [Bacteroidia bacterium]|nr:T9SS type A sorting domain-containing protein [Bacteroidia bacterium]